MHIVSFIITIIIIILSFIIIQLNELIKMGDEPRLRVIYTNIYCGVIFF